MSSLQWVKPSGAASHWYAYLGPHHDGAGITAAEVYELGIGSGNWRWRFALGLGRYSHGVGETAGSTGSARAAKKAVELRFARFLQCASLGPVELTTAEKKELESLRGRLELVRAHAGKEHA